MAETLYVIDGHSQIYRAYYAPFRNLTSPTGEPTRATYVFFAMLLKFIKQYDPKYLAMAIDGPAQKLLRRSDCPDYKVTRKPAPDDFEPQARRIIQVVSDMGIPVLASQGYEADDVIATMVRRFASADMNVVMVSRDKDLDQLIGEHVRFYDPMKDETLGAPEILAQKGYRPDQAIDVQSLAGDTIDNIPGIPGVGVKTAARLVAQYGSADEVIAHAEELTPSLRQRVLEHKANVALARKLVTLQTDVPLDIDLGRMAFRGLAAQKIRPVFIELGFDRLLEQLDQLGVTGTETIDIQATARREGQTTAADFDYRCIDSPEALERLTGEIAGVTRLAVDTETTDSRATWCDIVGVSLSWQGGKGVYLPVRGPWGCAPLQLDHVRRVLAPVLADERVMKIGHNLKYDWLVLDSCGMTIAGPIFDTMIAAHVLDSGRDSYSLSVLGSQLLNHRSIQIQDLIGRGKSQMTMDRVPIDAVTPYACEDADLTLRLADMLEPMLRAEGLYELFAGLEMPLLPILARMERRGILVDPEALKRMQAGLSKQAETLRARVIVLAGEEFNPDSPRQLAQVLFGKLGLAPIKSTKSGFSTDSDVLEQLAMEHEIAAVMLDYRALTKLLGTYTTALAQCIHPRTCRIHTSFHQTGTATGRLSSSDPNLQNIPIRSEEGRQIRSAFVAEEGSLLLSADYSQVEIRMLAHLCQDPTLLAGFRRDEDIHRIVAAEVFGVPVEQVTPDQRSRAKTVNFGIIYGQTAFGLAASLRIPRREAAEFIAAYRARFAAIDRFLQECVGFARRHGYVETIFKRRRRITGIDASNPSERALAERLAINSVVQGSAADLIKKAMIEVESRLRSQNRKARMLLQIHDELLLEVPAAELEAVRELVVEAMTGAVELTVPLRVEVGVGANWRDAK
jgi:DNA polymerase-1